MTILICLDNFARIPKGAVNFDSEIKKIDKNAKVVVCTSEKEVKENISDAEVFACFGSIFSPDLIKKGKKLKWVHAFSAGTNQFLIPEIINSEIILTNSSGVHPIQIGEHVFAMLLSFERGILSADRNKLAAKWDPSIDADEIFEKTICIVGAGNIGKRVAYLGKAFGCKIIGVNRSGEKPENFDQIFKMDKLKEAIKNADYVVNILPYTKETDKAFSSQEFKGMKKTAIFANVGRGKTVDEKALLEALKNKAIRGACLDVFEKEPLPKDSPFWKMDNVLITPHIAGKTPRYLERAKDIFIENLKAYLAKKPLPNLVDKNAGY